MSTNFVMDDDNPTVKADATLDGAIAEAIDLVRESGREVTFELNGVTVTVEAESIISLLLRGWRRELRGYIEKIFGLKPKA